MRIFIDKLCPMKEQLDALPSLFDLISFMNLKQKLNMLHSATCTIFTIRSTQESTAIIFNGFFIRLLGNENSNTCIINKQSAIQKSIMNPSNPLV